MQSAFHAHLRVRRDRAVGIRVLLGREERLAGTGATQVEIDKIINNAIKKNRKDGARNVA